MPKSGGKKSPGRNKAFADKRTMNPPRGKKKPTESGRSPEQLDVKRRFGNYGQRGTPHMYTQ